MPDPRSVAEFCLGLRCDRRCGTARDPGRNSCASGFSGAATYFRAVAVSIEGTEFAAATGRFSGEIKPYSTAETLVAIEADPTRIRSWRVELR